MSVQGGPDITSGLILYLDAANPKSYPESSYMWYDLTPYHNDASISGSFSYSSNGYFTFAATNNNFYNTTINCNPSLYTLNWWVYPITNANYNQWIELGGTSGSGHNYFAFATSALGYIYAGTFPVPTGRFELTTTGLVDTNQWQNFCFTMRSGSAAIYKNGNLLSSKNITVCSSTFTKVGSSSGANTAINGRFSNFAMYNVALTSSEILQNYNSLKGRYGL